MNPLDQLLPLLEPSKSELHLNVSVLEVEHEAQLIELAKTPKVCRYLLGRLSDTVALVDPGYEHDLAKALADAGHFPKQEESET